MSGKKIRNNAKKAQKWEMKCSEQNLHNLYMLRINLCEICLVLVECNIVLYIPLYVPSCAYEYVFFFTRIGVSICK